MEKDIGKIAKNDNTDIIVRIDDFGGKTGVTIREFVKGGGFSNYSGFTKAGTRIPADKFVEFREIINSLNIEDLKNNSSSQQTQDKPKEQKSKKDSDIEDY